ncbi:SGNH/GDSL hydrolase family protein [Nocardioides sp. J54]|uniref:SGNH/GDSL hydrolase family protein n=1 Tax=Nocardioides sp. J54 TaxID=935866 RepID=UPI00048BFB74|nr:GDSL-type esterase/lipase family protein [Nocardioides sp. J54]
MEKVDVRRRARRGRPARALLAAVLAALVVLAAGLAVLPGRSVASAAPDAVVPDPGGPLRVLVLGDSLSQGFAGDATWRYWFWREARRQGVDVDLVGPHSRPYLLLPSRVVSDQARYERPALAFDTDHSAWAGSTIDMHLAQVDSLMTVYAPDVVVVELGINDARHGQDGASIAAELDDLLARVWRRAPRVSVVLGQLPVHGTDPAVDAAAVAANEVLVAAHADDPRVSIAYLRNGWDHRKHSHDGLHANATGQTLLAHRFAHAFHRAGLLPGKPRVFRQRQWRPRVAPRVRVVGRKVTVDWSAARRQVKISAVRVFITRSDGQQKVRQRWIPADRNQLSRRLAPGTYRVRLVPRRGSMVGAPALARTVRLR